MLPDDAAAVKNRLMMATGRVYQRPGVGKRLPELQCLIESVRRSMFVASRAYRQRPR